MIHNTIKSKHTLKRMMTTQPVRRSERLRIANTNQKTIEQNKKNFESMYNYAFQMRQEKNPYNRTKYLIEFTKTFLKKYDSIYEHHRHTNKEHLFSRNIYMTTLNHKNAKLNKELEHCIVNSNLKLKTKQKLFQKIYQALDEKNIKYVDERIEAVCPTIQLNYDVITHIFSYF